MVITVTRSNFLARLGNGCYLYPDHMPNRSERPARERLQELRTQRGLSLRDLGDELGCSHVSLRLWERGERVPGKAYRAAIQLWSKGRIPASSWPRSQSEIAADQRIADKLERVRRHGS